jgi:hypothetical protein
MKTSSFTASRRRGICVWLGFLILAAVALFPPWQDTYVGTDSVRSFTDPHGHAFLFQPPHRPNLDWGVSVDYRQMLTEIGVGEAFVLALYLTWGRSPK